VRVFARSQGGGKGRGREERGKGRGREERGKGGKGGKGREAKRQSS